MEDLALSLEDFEALCGEGVLKPHARNLAVKPHARHWGAVEATGQVDIEGFFPNSVLRLAGFKIKAEESSFENGLIRVPEGQIPGLPSDGVAGHGAAGLRG